MGFGDFFDGFKTIMTNFDLNQVDDLEFIDEYPKIREPLRLFENSIMDTNELIIELKK